MHRIAHELRTATAARLLARTLDDIERAVAASVNEFDAASSTTSSSSSSPSSALLGPIVCWYRP